MHSEDTRDVRQPSTTCPLNFNETKLKKDVLSAVFDLFARGEEFTGHDQRQYVIVGVKNQESDAEIFIVVRVKIDEGHRVAAKYAVMLQQISR
jgi:hypothetical protein